MAKQVVVDLKANTGEVQKGMDKLADAIADLNKALGGFNKEAENLDEVADSAKKADGGFKKFGKTLGSLGKAGGLVFLITKAFEIFKEVLGQNQTIVDATGTAIEFLSIAFNDLFSFLQNNVEPVVGFFKSIFEDPKQSLIDFANAFKRNIQERFESYLDTLGFLASAVKKVFSGDFAGAMEDVKNAGKESLDVITGVNNTFDKTKETVANVTGEIVKYTKRTFESAKGTVELNKQAQLADALQQGLIEKYDLQAEQQRQIRDDESKTIEERIKANEKLGEILDKQEEEMMKNAQLRVDAAARELAKNEDNLEAQVALIEAENELAAVQAQVAGFRSEQLTNINSLERERLDLIDEEKEKQEQAVKDQEILEKAKVDMVKNTFGNIAAALGQNSKAGKAFAAAQALINTYQGISAELATKTATPFGFALKLANIASTAAIGFKSVKDILKTNPKSVSGAGNTSVGRGGGGSQAPAFNIVGASDSNQLADAIAGQSQQPVRAFVVSNDVTSAQELDRNIIEGASIG
tara:strand:+ start:283 stop:1857 length:1575 start_codon:yes stop_codon:yes gene_type:complete